MSIQLQSLPCQFAEAQRSGYSWVKVLPLTYGRARTPVGDWLGPSCLDLRTIPKRSSQLQNSLQELVEAPAGQLLHSAQFWSSHFLVDGSMETTGQLNHPIQLSESVQGIPSNKQFSSLQFLHLQYVVISSICIMGPGRLVRLMYYIKFYTTPGIL